MYSIHIGKLQLMAEQLKCLFVGTMDTFNKALNQLCLFLAFANAISYHPIYLSSLKTELSHFPPFIFII